MEGVYSYSVDIRWNLLDNLFQIGLSIKEDMVV